MSQTINRVWSLTTATKEELEKMERLIARFIVAKDDLSDDPLTQAQKDRYISLFKVARAQAQANLATIQSLEPA